MPERRSFDYVRHGTIDLFAALNIATGNVISKLSAQHRATDSPATSMRGTRLSPRS